MPKVPAPYCLSFLGRITPWDIGIWSDAHIEPLSRIVKFVHAHGAKIGLQLAHAGRKASTHALWTVDTTGKILVEEEDGGWPDRGTFRAESYYRMLELGG